MGEIRARFGADTAEPVTLGLSGAIVLRLQRRGEELFWKHGPGVADEAARLDWLRTTGIGCPRVLDRGDDWMLTTRLPGRDLAQPWPDAQRGAVLDAMLDGLRAIHALDVATCPIPSPYPVLGSEPVVVTHGDYCCPNVCVDPDTLRFTGVLDVGKLGVGDRYVDLCALFVTLAGALNPQYGGELVARRVIEAYGGAPDDPRIAAYYALDHPED